MGVGLVGFWIFGRERERDNAREQSSYSPACARPREEKDA